MHIKYIPFFAENPDEQIAFFTEHLGFKLSEKIGLHKESECTTLQTGSADVLLAVSDNSLYKNCNSCMVLSTDDCLKDYHQLKAAGLIFCKEPHYLPAGLVAEFSDNNGNRFILLEERDYNDDI